MKYFIEKLPHLKRFQVYLSWDPIDITPQLRFGPRSIFVCHPNFEDLVTLFSTNPTSRQLATTQLNALGIVEPDHLPITLLLQTTPVLPHSIQHDTEHSTTMKSPNPSTLPTLNIMTRVLTDPQTRSLSHLYEKEIIRFDCHIDSEEIRVVEFQPGSAILSIEITDDKHLQELVNPFHLIFDTLSYFERTVDYLQHGSISLRNDHMPLLLYQYLNPSISNNSNDSNNNHFDLHTDPNDNNHNSHFQLQYPRLESEAHHRNSSLQLGPINAIKPIPSADWQDVSEIWFCHNEDKVTIAESKRNSICLRPRDVFIDDSLVILHSYDTIPIQPSNFPNNIDPKPQFFSSHSDYNCEHSQPLQLISPLQTQYIPPFMAFQEQIHDDLNISSPNPFTTQPKTIPLRLHPTTQLPESYSFPPEFFQAFTAHPQQTNPWSNQQLSIPFFNYQTPSQSLPKPDHHHGHNHNGHCDHHHEQQQQFSCSHTNSQSTCSHSDPTSPQTLPIIQFLSPKQPTLLSLFIQSLQLLLNIHTSFLNSPHPFQSTQIPLWAHYLTHNWPNIVYKLLFRTEPFIALSTPIHHNFPSTSLNTSTSSSTQHNDDPFIASPAIGEALLALSLNSTATQPISDPILLSSLQSIITILSPSNKLIKIEDEQSLRSLISATSFLFHSTFSIQQLDLVALFKFAIEGHSALFQSLFQSQSSSSSLPTLLSTSSTPSTTRSICDLCCRHHPEHCQHVFPQHQSFSRASKQFQSLPLSTQSLYPISPSYNIFHMYSLESILISALLKLSQTKLGARFAIMDFSQTFLFYITIVSNQIYLQSSNTPQSDLLDTNEFRQLTMPFFPAVKVQYHFFNLLSSSTSTTPTPPSQSSHQHDTNFKYNTTHHPRSNLKITTVSSFQPLFNFLAQQPVPVTHLTWDRNFIYNFATICAIRQNELPTQLIKRHLEQSVALSSSQSLAQIHSKTAAMLAKLQLAPNQRSQSIISSALQASSGNTQPEIISQLLTSQLDTSYLYKPILPNYTSLRDE